MLLTVYQPQTKNPIILNSDHVESIIEEPGKGFYQVNMSSGRSWNLTSDSIDAIKQAMFVPFDQGKTSFVKKT